MDVHLPQIRDPRIFPISPTPNFPPSGPRDSVVNRDQYQMLGWSLAESRFGETLFV